MKLISLYTIQHVSLLGTNHYARETCQSFFSHQFCIVVFTRNLIPFIFNEHMVVLFCVGANLQPLY